MAERSEGRTNKFYYAQGTNPSLSLDLIPEILSWLPVQSIIISKCVCKHWKSIIEDSKFVELHMNRASTVIIPGEPDDLYVQKNKFKIVSSSEGLVLEQRGPFYRIKNPATRQVLLLPNHVKGQGCMHFNCVPGSMVYKLIHLYAKGMGSHDVDCEVLTVGEDLAWRGFNIPSLKNILEGNPRIFECANTSDTLHIIRIPKDGLSHPTIIILNFVTESASCFEIPRKFLWDWNNVHPLYWKEKLCLTTIVGDKLMIWVLENNKINQWADREIIIPLTSAKDFFRAGDKVCASALSGSILEIAVNDHISISYDIEKKKVRFLSPIPIRQISSFVLRPSLVQLKGMEAERIEG